MLGLNPAGLSLAASGRCSSLRCVEISGAGERAFWRSAARLPTTHVHLEYHVASAGSSPAAWLEQVDVAILDPPRKGLDAELLAFLCGQLPAATTRNSAPARNLLIQMKEGNSCSAAAIAEVDAADVPAADRVPSAVPKSKRALRHSKKHNSRKPPKQRLEHSLSGESLPHTLQKLIYLSCGWTSFVRDSDALTASGEWHLVSTKAFVFFPGTDSIETLAVFQRAQQQT